MTHSAGNKGHKAAAAAASKDDELYHADRVDEADEYVGDRLFAKSDDTQSLIEGELGNAARARNKLSNR